jgi:aldose 1-epimerase
MDAACCAKPCPLPIWCSTPDASLSRSGDAVTEKHIKVWGELDEGRHVKVFGLTNAAGTEVWVSELGATLTNLLFADRSGRRDDIVLGFASPREQVGGQTYFGATVGRYGNRIRRGRFSLDGEEYQLARNEGENHLHGGGSGFDKKIWLAMDAPEDTLRFGLVSRDGDEGFPGDLIADVAFRLGEDDTLHITMTASVSKPCPVNMVHHSYWNLAGHASGTVLNQQLQILADFYTPADEKLLLTGEIKAVVGTPYDFTEPKLIGRDTDRVVNDGAGRTSGARSGFDHNWVLRGERGRLRPVVRALDPVSGRGFELSTTEPGVHFYHGGYLDGVRGKDSVIYPAHAGFTLETQLFPDSPNIPHFPSARLDPGQIYSHQMAFQFSR